MSEDDPTADSITDVHAYETILVHLPPLYQHTNENVFVARGLNNGVYVYTKDGLDRMQRQVDGNSEKYNLKYPNFKKFMLSGIVKTILDKNGNLLLPTFLHKYMGPGDDVEFTQTEHWLEICKKHPDQCRCPDPNCAKCLSGNCRDLNCSIHPSR